MEKYKLSYIASIASGYPFKGAIDYSDTGNILVVQPKDVSDEKLIDYNLLIKADLSKVNERLMLETGDILFKAKSSRYDNAVIIAQAMPMIPTSHFFIIKPDLKIVIPEYLSWFLKQKSTKAYLVSNSGGTTVPMITKPTLEGLEVFLPSLEIQQKIVRLDQLYSREKELVNQIYYKKDQLTENLLSKLCKGEML